jgi:formylglycine-generating enzyme required for sulfatase activity
VLPRAVLAALLLACSSSPEPTAPQQTGGAGGTLATGGGGAGGEAPLTVEVPAGSFVMGSPAAEPGRDPDEGPQQTLAMAAFAVDVTPVTAGAFMARTAEVAALDPQARWYTPADQPGSWTGQCNLGTDRLDHPANCVDWRAARAYCRVRSMDLPTEAEREYAMRAGSVDAYSWGATFDAAHVVSSVPCGTRGCAGGTQPAVTSGPRCNAWGACDTCGNVWEWTLTEYQQELGPYVTLVLDTVPNAPVMRGGAWVNEQASLFRSAHRGLAQFASGLTEIGFRCVAR